MPINIPIKLDIDSSDLDQAIKKTLVLQERLREVGEVREDLVKLLADKIKEEVNNEVKKIVKDEKVLEKALKEEIKGKKRRK